jgi:hypothetical protein
MGGEREGRRSFKRDRRLFAVVNGEISRFAELAEELKARVLVFKRVPDVEVFAHDNNRQRGNRVWKSMGVLNYSLVR